MTVAVVSSLYGDAQDRFGPQPDQTVDAEWIMVTDLETPADPGPWRFVHEPRTELGPRMAAKLAKFRPDLYTDARTVVWMDAAARFRDRHGLERLLEWSRGRICQWRHPYRDCLYDEAEASRDVWKYGHQNLEGQVAAYRKARMPEHWGMWATGVIVRRCLAEDFYDGTSLERFGDAWLTEQFRWSDQDQVSEPYCCWSQGLRPHELPHSIFDNPAISWDYAGRRW